MSMPGPSLLVAVPPLTGRTGGVVRPAASHGATWLTTGDLMSPVGRSEPGAPRRDQELAGAGLGMHDPFSETTS